MLHKEMLGLALLFFVLWIFFAGNPGDRIERGCKPVAWAGNVVTSISALAAPKYQTTTQKWSDNLTYSCEFTAWRLFYQADYNKWLAEQAAASGPLATHPLATPTVPGQPTIPATVPAAPAGSGAAPVSTSPRN
jgi:hypothetical protein